MGSEQEKEGGEGGSNRVQREEAEADIVKKGDPEQTFACFLHESSLLSGRCAFSFCGEPHRGHERS
jgi:hypothetical protein